jgi:hypothetical protein
VVDLLSKKHCPPERLLDIFKARQHQNDELKAKQRTLFAKSVPVYARRIKKEV